MELFYFQKLFATQPEKKNADKTHITWLFQTFAATTNLTFCLLIFNVLITLA